MPARYDPNVKKMLEEKDILGLAKSLRSSSISVKTSAARALDKLGSKIKDAAVVGELIKALNDAEISDLACSALVKTDDPRVSTELLKLVSNNHHSTRGLAAEFLGQIQEPKAVEPLINLLSDSDQQVQVKAITALGKLGDTQACDPLAKIFEKAPNFAVELAIAESLEKLGDKRIIEFYEKAITGYLLYRYNVSDAGASIGPYSSWGGVAYYGQKLNQLGGLKLVKKVFNKFAWFTPDNYQGAEARKNLIDLWADIGDWGNA